MKTEAAHPARRRFSGDDRGEFSRGGATDAAADSGLAAQLIDQVGAILKLRQEIQKT